MAVFTIHSAPVGKARVRVTTHGTYTPKKTRDYATDIDVGRKEGGTENG